MHSMAEVLLCQKCKLSEYALYFTLMTMLTAFCRASACSPLIQKEML